MRTLIVISRLKQDGQDYQDGQDEEAVAGDRPPHDEKNAPRPRSARACPSHAPQPQLHIPDHKQVRIRRSGPTEAWGPAVARGPVPRTRSV